MTNMQLTPALQPWVTQESAEKMQVSQDSEVSEKSEVSKLPTGSIRDGFGKALADLGKENDAIVAVSADLTESTRLSYFKTAFPERFVQVGVAEQNLIGVSAGMALAGKQPFAASFAVFSPGRSWDQIRVSVCYSNLNVKIIGGHAGLTVGPDGATHQALEDIAMMRVLPNMIVVVPCDEDQAAAATRAIADHTGPAYLRSSREKPIKITTPNTPFEIGKAQLLREGSDVTLIATGIMVQKSLLAARELAKENISARVINMHTIKPLDTEAILSAAQETGKIITVEEHQQAGGLGSAVAEFLGQHHPTPLKIIGVNDTFGESGESEELLEKYGLGVSEIVAQTKKVLH